MISPISHSCLVVKMGVEINSFIFAVSLPFFLFFLLCFVFSITFAVRFLPFFLFFFFFFAVRFLSYYCEEDALRQLPALWTGGLQKGLLLTRTQYPIMSLCFRVGHRQSEDTERGTTLHEDTF